MYVFDLPQVVNNLCRRCWVSIHNFDRKRTRNLYMSFYKSNTTTYVLCAQQGQKLEQIIWYV